MSEFCVLFAQAYNLMEMTRECISFTFDPRGMLLSLQMGFNFVRAAVAVKSLRELPVLSNHLSQLLRGIDSIGWECPHAYA